MVKVTLPPYKQYCYSLYDGAYDGSFFVCGPGEPFLPPSVLVLTEEIEQSGEFVLHRYQFDRTLDKWGGYQLAAEKLHDNFDE